MAGVAVSVASMVVVLCRFESWRVEASERMAKLREINSAWNNIGQKNRLGVGQSGFRSGKNRKPAGSCGVCGLNAEC